MRPERKNAEWIRNTLIPHLVDSGKISIGSSKLGEAIRNIDVTKISLEESTMLTDCYRVRVTLESEAENLKHTEMTSVASLVVKVCN